MTPKGDWNPDRDDCHTEPVDGSNIPVPDDLNLGFEKEERAAKRKDLPKLSMPRPPKPVARRCNVILDCGRRCILRWDHWQEECECDCLLELNAHREENGMFSRASGGDPDEDDVPQEFKRQKRREDADFNEFNTPEDEAEYLSNTERYHEHYAYFNAQEVDGRVFAFGVERNVFDYVFQVRTVKKKGKKRSP